MNDFNLSPLEFKASDGGSLLFRQGVFHAEKPGPFALFLFLHGAGERGSDNTLQMTHIVPPLPDYFLSHGMKVLFLIPQCPSDRKWADTPWDAVTHEMTPEPSVSMKRVTELLDAKTKEFDIDPARHYLAGLSMGGYGAWDLLFRRRAFFASALILCGGGDASQVSRVVDLPLFIVHGTRDDAVPVENARRMADALRKAGSKTFQYREVPEAGHDVWTQSFTDTALLDWLFAQRGV